MIEKESKGDYSFTFEVTMHAVAKNEHEMIVGLGGLRFLIRKTTAVGKREFYLLTDKNRYPLTLQEFKTRDEAARWLANFIKGTEI